MQPLKLLLIDDDALDRRSIARAVAALGSGYELHEASDCRLGVELAQAGTFDCILLDYSMPQMNGLDVLSELLKGITFCTPVVMLTGSGNEMIAVEAMKMGASDYLQKERLKPDSLFRAVSHAVEKSLLQKRLVEAQQKVERMALFDDLTGLGNRNLFQVELGRAVAISQRSKLPFALLMMDLNKFKLANDTYGHQTGDALLAGVGRRLRQMARAADAYFRVGGDEFTAILDAGSNGRLAADRICSAIAEPFVLGSHTLTVHVSIGLASFPDDGESDHALLRAADAAMYREKKSKTSRKIPAQAANEDRAHQGYIPT